MTLGRPPIPVIDRIMALTQPCPMSGCWLFTGCVIPSGHGHIGLGANVLPKSAYVHRAVYEHLIGRIPSGAWVLHRCDVPCCVNPHHLYLGTHNDNMADMRRKGRRKGIGLGETNGRAKLRDTDVLLVRELYRTGTTAKHIAARFGIHLSSVSRLCRTEATK